MRRTWGRRGRTPLIALSRRRRRRINASGWLCVAPDGSHTRLVFTTSRTGYRHYDFPELIDRVHERLGAPLVLVWDNHPSHRTAWLRHRLAQRTWLSVVHLPRYAPELNPVETMWSQVKTRIANRAFRSVEEVERALRSALFSVQRRPDVLSGFIRSVGLDPCPLESTT
ncbi:hypothetical protein GCM10009799_51120 [Nocardiopsis rhodophaea]|uniref:Tc1-like transposase DDE domain-containing protein n=2 Tax=Nocardiopsis rhodophaea TaxID=280238 RepID=A0ABP5F6B0_9ACTN